MSSAQATRLTCPKCHGAMRSYERGGVTIDQCEECRGIFLDRGELDRLIDAEGSFYQPDRRGDDRDRYPERPYPERAYPDRAYPEHYGEQQHRDRHKRKRGGFLSDLFDD